MPEYDEEMPRDSTPPLEAGVQITRSMILAPECKVVYPSRDMFSGRKKEKTSRHTVSRVRKRVNPGALKIAIEYFPAIGRRYRAGPIFVIESLVCGLGE